MNESKGVRVPFVEGVIQQTVIERVAGALTWEEGWEQIVEDLRPIVAREMSSLVADNETPMILDPKQVTCKITLAGAATDGYDTQLSSNVAAVLNVWAFDYPSREGRHGQNYDDLSDTTKRMIADHGLIRPMDERLRDIQRGVRGLLGHTELDIEVNFVPQQKGHWVGG